MKFYTYVCDTCRKSSRVSKDEPVPFCCGKLMTRVDQENRSEDFSDK